MALVEINAENPQERKIEEVVECLRKGGVIVYPTDTVYALGCDIHNGKAVEQICRIKGIKVAKANFSIICEDISQLSNYARQFDNYIFKVMKKAFPGPFTFILPANSNVPKLLHSKKKTIGIRIPDHKIPLEIVRGLGHPIITTSIHDDDEVLEYTTDPELIHERYEKTVDLVVDGGFGQNVASTIVNYATGELEVVREGLGDIHAIA